MPNLNRFSYKELNRLSVNERVRKGHPGNMHMWWNRSPIESSGKLLKDVLSEGIACTKFADQETTEQNDGPASEAATIVDPFSGFGGLVLAAAEAGYPVMAGDLNSVATILTKAAAEIPALLPDVQPVSPNAKANLYTRLQRLAEDVRCYGNWMRNELESRLNAIYPESVFAADSDSKRVYAWVWARTAPCPNPACGCTMPLAGSYVLSKLKGREYYVEPEVVDQQIRFHVRKGFLKEAQQGNKIGISGAKFRCPSCGEITKDEYVKEMGKAGKLGVQLMAVGYETDAGRIYETPSQTHLTAANMEPPTDLPLGDLPDNTRWFSPPLFGLSQYADLYTPRQLLLMTTLCDLVKEARKKAQEDAVRAGMDDDALPLSDGGCGAYAYSQAVSVYLSLVVGKIANFQSEICTWDNRKGNIRAAFTRQALPMTWVFAEGNPFSSVTGNFDTMLADVVRSVAGLPCTKNVKVMQGDGTVFPFPPNSILFTELPYYDNVGYADLSDYFYIWLRRCLKEVYPDLFKNVVTSKEELTSIPEHYGGDAKAARAAYQEGIRRLFRNFSSAADKKRQSFVFFEFGKSDEAAMRSSGQIATNQESPEPAKKEDIKEVFAWENLIDSLNEAGFQIIAVLPVRTEKPDEKKGSTRVCLIFQKRIDNAPQTTRRAFVSELKKKLPKMLRSIFTTGIDKCDQPITGMGAGLSIFTKYERIINADGSSMQTRDALHVIWTEAEECIRDYELETDSEEDSKENRSNNGYSEPMSGSKRAGRSDKETGSTKNGEADYAGKL